MADLGNIKAGERVIRILTPKEEKFTGVIVTLVSLGDERSKNLRRQITDEGNKLAVRGKFYKFDQVEENKVKLVFKSMTGWNWGMNEEEQPEQAVFNGAIPEFNEKNVKEVFEALPWFQQQLEDALNENKDFFAK